MNKAEKPLYQIIEDYVLDKIKNREYVEGDPIPTEKEFCQMFNTSRSTVNKALNTLVNKGAIYRTAGRGSFVRMYSVELQISKLMGYKEQMSKMNISSSTQILSYSQVNASRYEDIQKIFNLKNDELFHRIERIRYIDNEPIALEIINLNPKVIKKIDLEAVKDSLYDFIENDLKLKIGYSDFTIRALEANEDIRKIFPKQITVPILKHEQISYLMDGLVFEFNETYYLADKYEYKGRNYR
jgi:GntR family transcriptional regulator